MKQERKGWCGLGLVLGVILLAFGPIVVGRATLVPTDLLHQLILPYGAAVTTVSLQNHYTMDVLTQFYPAYDFFAKRVATGEWPLWNQYVYGGHPIFASSLYSFANPFNAVFWVLPMPAAFHWRTILQFLAAGGFCYLLLRDHGLRVSACALGALAYALNTQFLFHYWFGGFQTMVWLPLVLLFFERSLRGHWWFNISAASLAGGAALLAGNLQSATYLPLLLTVYAAGGVFWLQWRLRAVVGALTLVFLLALGVAAIQFVPAVELLGLDANRRVGQALTTGTWWDGWRAVPCSTALVAPAFWGSPQTFSVMRALRVSAADFHAYLGIVPIVLLGLGLATQRTARTRVLAACGLGVLLLLFLVPGVRQLLYYRALGAYTLPAAMLAAWGFDQLLRLDLAAGPAACRYARRAGAVLALGALGVLLVQLAVVFFGEQLLAYSRQLVAARLNEGAFASEAGWLEARLTQFWQHYRLTNPAFFLPFVAGGVACWVVWRIGSGRPLRPAVPLLVGLTIVELLWLTRHTIPMVDVGRYPLVPPLPELAATTDPETRVARRSQPGRRLLPDNLLMTYGIASVTGYESLTPRSRWHSVLAAGQSLDDQAWGEAGATHFVEFTTNGLQLTPNPARQPRVRLSAPGTARIKSDRGETLTIAVHVEQPSTLELADTYYPGWRATVDGVATPIHRTNAAYRAIALPAGSQQVQFTFRPQSVYWGAGISAVTIATLLIVLLLARCGNTRLPT